MLGNENGASESLQDSLNAVTKPLQDFYKMPIKRLQDSNQETTGHTSAEMIECLSFLLLGTLVALLGAAACYLYSLLTMVEASINNMPLGGTLRSSKNKHDVTKAHQVCPNWKQPAVSGQGLH